VIDEKVERDKVRFFFLILFLFGRRVDLMGEVLSPSIFMTLVIIDSEIIIVAPQERLTGTSKRDRA